MEFVNYDGKVKSATYLPEVAKDQGEVWSGCS